MTKGCIHDETDSMIHGTFDYLDHYCASYIFEKVQNGDIAYSIYVYDTIFGSDKV